MKEIFRAVRHYIRYTDKLLLMMCMLATGYGIVLIYSATYSYNTLQYVRLQGIAALLGVGAYIVASFFSMEFFTRYWKWILLFNLLLLGSLFFFGVGDGNKSWIRFPGLGAGIQPAEIGKILFIVTFASHLHELEDRVSTFYGMFQLLLHAAATAGSVMVFSQDDGMTLAFLFIAIFMAFAAGIKYRWFLVGGVAAVGATPLVWNYILQDYQKLRILVTFNPSLDPDKAYQANQSKIALGAGMLTGRGLLQGTQTQYGLIPTKHTDSIFAVAGEELGFIGCFGIILLLTLIVFRCLYIAVRTSGSASSLICSGVAGMLIFQTVLNIGMNIGIFPIIGLTLPFFSYGGSSLVSLYIAMGIVAGIRLREKRTRLRRSD